MQQPSRIDARGNSPAAIDRAYAEQMRHARPGILGPGPLPMVVIPRSDGASAAAVSTKTSWATGPTLPRPLLVAAGIAVTYGRPIRIGSEWHVLAPGCFRSSMADVNACLSHYQHVVVGSTRDGTLRLRDGRRALEFSVSLETEAAAHWALSRDIRRGDVWGTSVRFRFNVDHAHESAPDTYTIARATLHELSLIWRPRKPLDPTSSVRIALGCVNCWGHGAIGHVHFTQDRLHAWRCTGCGMPHRRA